MWRLRHFLTLAIIAICGLASPLYAQEALPAGTVIAIVLDRALDSGKSKPGQRIVARVAQAVPLDGQRMIPLRSKVFGEITVVENALGHARLGLRFDRLELGKTEIAISTKLRALASALEVNSAETSFIISDANVSGAETAVQIGGRTIVYRGAGTVENEKGEVVGKPVRGGVLGIVENRPDSQCEGIPVNKSPQAIWLFPPDACGVYGFRNLSFENGSDEKPEILFVKKNKKEWNFTKIDFPAGSALLLAVTVPPGH